MAAPALVELAHARQERVSARADRAVAEVDRATRRAWLHLLAALRQGSPASVRSVLHALPGLLRQAIAGELVGLARWGHRSARSVLARSLPQHALRRALAHRAAGRRHLLHEDRVGAGLDLADLWAHFRGVPGEGGPSLLDLLFPPPTLAQVEAVVYASGWQDRLRSGTGLAAPAALARHISTGLVLGHDQATIARRLRDAVQGVRSTARRIARTESLRVASAMQMACHRQLGDLVVGYTVHATLDANTRPEHRARDGTTYWKHPGPGQKGMDQCPRPPQEADGSMAWNCRCYLTPVLAE